MHLERIICLCVQVLSEMEDEAKFESDINSGFFWPMWSFPTGSVIYTMALHKYTVKVVKVGNVFSFLCWYEHKLHNNEIHFRTSFHITKSGITVIISRYLRKFQFCSFNQYSNYNSATTPIFIAHFLIFPTLGPTWPAVVRKQETWLICHLGPAW